MDPWNDMLMLLLPEMAWSKVRVRERTKCQGNKKMHGLCLCGSARVAGQVLAQSSARAMVW